MKKVLLLALALPLVACTVGDAPSDPGGDDGSGGGGGGSGGGGGGGGGGGSGGGGNGISGTINADTAWSGTINLLGDVTIAAGKTITVAPGTTIKTTNAYASINILGTLDEQGAKDMPIAVNSISIAVKSGGTLKTTYATHTGGAIETTTGSTATITDSVLSHASGDFLVMSGGTVTMDHSQIGVGTPADATKGSDTTHCDMHFNKADGSVIKINHSNIASSSFGIMLYQSDADLTNNNWYGNEDDFEKGVANISGAKADGGWFKSGMPSGVPGVTFANLAASPLTDAGPR